MGQKFVQMLLSGAALHTQTDNTDTIPGYEGTSDLVGK